MRKEPIPAWLLLMLAAAGLLLVAIPGLWVFVSVTATPLYPSPEDVPTAMRSAPLPRWAGAAEQGRQLVRASVAGQNLPGLSVAVGVDGDVVWAEGFGFADLWTSEPVTPDHRFRIGTASAALTSAAAGLLLEDGRLKLDDEIQTYVPAFPKKQWPVTLRELMAHTAGVASAGNPFPREHCEGPAEALQYFAENPLLFRPGTEYRHSTYGWILASAAIEAAAGQPFLTFLRERVFDPLGMRDTAADPSPDLAAVEGEDFPPFILIRELIYDPGATRGATSRAANKPVQSQVTPYFTRFRSDPNYGVHLARLVDYSCYAGASVFVSTPSDLVRFGLAMNSGKLLQPATVELLQETQRLASGEPTGHGLGWRLRTVKLAGKPTPAIGHNGESLGGMVASLLTFTEYGIVVAVTSNIPFADTFSIAVEIAEIFAQRGKSPGIGDM